MMAAANASDSNDAAWKVVTTVKRLELNVADVIWQVAMRRGAAQ